MKGLRKKIVGITDTLVSAVDGLLVESDTDRAIDPDGLAALAAAGLGVARQTVAATERGELRRVVTYGSQGCAVVYAVGDVALMVVLGDEGLDVDRLHQESKAVLKRLGEILTDGA